MHLVLNLRPNNTELLESLLHSYLLARRTTLFVFESSNGSLNFGVELFVQNCHPTILHSLHVDQLQLQITDLLVQIGTRWDSAALHLIGFVAIVNCLSVRVISHVFEVQLALRVRGLLFEQGSLAL